MYSFGWKEVTKIAKITKLTKPTNSTVIREKRVASLLKIAKIMYLKRTPKFTVIRKTIYLIYEIYSLRSKDGPNQR